VVEQPTLSLLETTVAVWLPLVLSVKRDGYRSVTNGGDVHRSPGGRFLRSAVGVKGGRRPSTRTGAKRRPLTPASTAGEWAPDSGRFVITSSVVACSFCESGNTLAGSAHWSEQPTIRRRACP
jgi:hypothetical protein